MCVLLPQQLRITTEKNKIPHCVLRDILMVYEHGKREDVGKYPNEFICERNGDFWTTWSEVFELRDRIKPIKEQT